KLISKGCGDGARSRAQVQNVQRTCLPSKMVHRGFDQDFSLNPRDKDSWCDFDIEAVELGGTDEVLQWGPRSPSFSKLGDVLHGVVIELLPQRAEYSESASGSTQ